MNFLFSNEISSKIFHDALMLSKNQAKWPDRVQKALFLPRHRTSVYCPVIVSVDPVVLLSDIMTTQNVSHIGLGYSIAKISH